MNADPRVTEFFPHSYTRERSESNAEIIRERLARDGYGWWAVEIRAGAPFAGLVALQKVPFEAAFTPANEIGWRFAPEYWGRCYATEGARGALAFAFDELRWREVVAFAAVSNVRSRRVMERLRMTHDPRDDFDHPRVEAGPALPPRTVSNCEMRLAPPRRLSVGDIRRLNFASDEGDTVTIFAGRTFLARAA